MKTFSRLSLFTLVCLGLMLVSNADDVYAQSALEVSGETGADKIYRPGDLVDPEPGFTATDDGAPVVATLTITSEGLDGVPATIDTELPLGSVAFEGVRISEDLSGLPTRDGKYVAFIEAEWRDKDKKARQEFLIEELDPGAPVVIVVDEVNFDEPLMSTDIDRTFTQTISLWNNHGERSTLPLSAWQMEIGYNPLILEFVEVTPANFLQSNGAETVWTGPPESSPGQISPGEISIDVGGVSQVAQGTIKISEVSLGSGIAIQAGTRKKLLDVKFKVRALADAPLTIGNVRLQSDTDHDPPNSDPEPDRISYSVLVSDFFAPTRRSSLPEDVNQDLMVDSKDIMEVAKYIGVVPYPPRADVNKDGVVSVLDAVLIAQAIKSGKKATPLENAKNASALEADVAATAPAANIRVDAAMIQTWIDLARIEDDGSAIFDLGIANLEALLASRIPSETKLLLNYPNPFNPETWIPYQLAESTEVTVMIHSMNGSLIRTIELGHQSAGTYKSKSQAAYWDGRNELGEQVASGLYFYTLTAGDFTATHKMLVRK